MAVDNKSLGRFILDGVPPAPRGVPQVEVTFDIDANGILNVSAKDKTSGKEQKITITASAGLSDEEIEKMKKEAEAHAEEDKKKKELIETRNMAESLVFTAEKALKDAGDKVDIETKKSIETKIEELKKVKETEDKDAIKKAFDELGAEIQKIGAQMQEAQQAQAGGDSADSSTESEDKTDDSKKDNDEVVEGEVIDEK